MNITVILCTYNRSQSLQRALNSAAALSLPAGIEWEVLVVDNNSSDQTREVVEDFCRTRPSHFRYLFEPKKGKSNALNSGIREARGDVLAFMDDDVTVEPTWLENLTAPLRDGEWAGTGGPIYPDWTSAPPRWIPRSRNALAPLAGFDLGPEARQLDEAPVGTNMAFRKEVFQKYGGFRTDLGPCPGTMIRGEDSEFGNRLLTAGERLLYEPSAVVFHELVPSRLQKKYFLGWWLDKGRSEIRERGIPSGTKYQIGGVPLYLIRRLAVWTLRWLVAVKPAARFDNKIKVWILWGQITECYRQLPPQDRSGSMVAKPSR